LNRPSHIAPQEDWPAPVKAMWERQPLAAATMLQGKHLSPRPLE